METRNKIRGGMIDIHHHVLGGNHPKMRELPEWNMEIDACALAELGIDGALLSLPVAAKADVTRQINTMLHKCASFAPERYGILCSLPLAEPECTAKEIAFACEELNADGFIVPLLKPCAANRKSLWDFPLGSTRQSLPSKKQKLKCQ